MRAVMINLIKLRSPDFLIGRILFLTKALADILLWLLRQPSKRSFYLARLLLQVKPKYTMVSVKRLINLYELVQRVNAIHLPGDIVECGVWNGGSAAIMSAACRDNKNHLRTVWLFDSFAGLPPPGSKDGEHARDAYFEGWCHGSVEEVTKIFNQLHLSLDPVRIITGWFNSTLKTESIKTIALLHIDADWYESVKVVLEELYDKVVDGGFIVLDDYWTWQGCRQAIREYLREHQIEGVVFKSVDSHGVYFQKPPSEKAHQSDPKPI